MWPQQPRQHLLHELHHTGKLDGSAVGVQMAEYINCLIWEFIKDKKLDLKYLFFSWLRSCFLSFFLNQVLVFFPFFLGRKRVFFLIFLKSFFYKFPPLVNKYVLHITQSDIYFFPTDSCPFWPNHHSLAFVK